MSRPIDSDLSSSTRLLYGLPAIALLTSIFFPQIWPTFINTVKVRYHSLTMSGLKPGDAFPIGIKFKYIPYEESKPDIQACGTPINYDTSKQWKGKKVVLFAVPGAFTPGCSQRHLPGYIEKYSQLKQKGIDIIAVIAYNDPFVMSAWGKANNQKGDILFLTDVETAFSQKIGWTAGERTGRYAIVLDGMKVVYAAKEESPSDVTVSGVDAVLAKL